MEKSQNNQAKNKLKETHCTLCGSKQAESFLPELRLVRCLGCGVVYADEQLPLEELKKLYSKDYFTSPCSMEQGYDDYLEDRPLIRHTFQKRLDMLEKYYPEKGKLLDVGCAMGFFVEVAGENNWEAEGLDISDFCIQYMKEKGLKAHLTTLPEFECRNNSYDIITMWDYIEHSPAPGKDFEKSYQLLKPGGLLALITPDIESLPAKWFKKNWMGFKDYEHIYFFSGNVLKDALKKRNFEILKCRSAGKYISLDFFAKRLEPYQSAISKCIRSLIRKRWLPNINFYCNPLDMQLVIARKTSPSAIR